MCVFVNVRLIATYLFQCLLKYYSKHLHSVWRENWKDQFVILPLRMRQYPWCSCLDTDQRKS